MTEQTKLGPAPVMASAYPAHPLAEKFPRPSKTQYASLKADIASHGLIDPIILHEGKILDGLTRGAICNELGIAPRFETYQGYDPAAFVASKNLHRRHLNDQQRAMLAAAFAPDIGTIRAGEQFNVGPASVAAASQVRRKAVPEIVKAVEKGAVFVSNAAKVARLPAEQQREIAQRGPQAINSAGKGKDVQSFKIPFRSVGSQFAARRPNVLDFGKSTQGRARALPRHGRGRPGVRHFHEVEGRITDHWRYRPLSPYLGSAVPTFHRPAIRCRL